MIEANTLRQPRFSPARRLSVALLGVPAILLGLLAMHFIIGGNMVVAGEGTIASAEQVAMEGMVGGAPTSPDCGDKCAPTHDTLGMACALALLVSLVILTLHLFPAGWGVLRSVLNALATKAAALAPPTPPSLHVLSISRT